MSGINPKIQIIDTYGYYVRDIFLTDDRKTLIATPPDDENIYIYSLPN